MKGGEPPMSGRGLGPVQVPDGFWARADVTDALDRRDVGRLLRLVSQHSGASQTRVGAAVDLSQGTVSDAVRGKRQFTSLEVLQRIASGLGMPQDARTRLGLASTTVTPTSRRLSTTVPGHGSSPSTSPDDDSSAAPVADIPGEREREPRAALLDGGASRPLELGGAPSWHTVAAERDMAGAVRCQHDSVHDLDTDLSRASDAGRGRFEAAPPAQPVPSAVASPHEGHGGGRPVL